MENIKQLKTLFDSFHEAIYIVDRNRKILYFNPVAEKISGFTAEEIVGSYCFDNKLNHIDDAGKQLCLNGCPLVDSICSNKINEAHVYLHHKKGHRVPVHIRTIPYLRNGKVVGAIEVFTSETKRNLCSEALLVQKNLNFIDPLTGLFNRCFMEMRLREFLQTEQDTMRALLFIDLDGFKSINDTYGHLKGDEVLKMVANTLLANTRSNDYVIRFGGDEILIVSEIESISALHDLANRIGVLVQNSRLRDGEHEISILASIGVTVIIQGEPLETAIDRADKAMYLAKKKGKNRICVFEDYDINQAA